MTLLPTSLRTPIVLVAVAAGTILASPPADAGVRDTLRNVSDTMKCTSKAVFNPLRVFEWGMKNFENLTGEEYERRADQSMKEALDKCREAAENIVARGFGVKGLPKARAAVKKLGAKARSAAQTVSKWFGKGAKTRDDRRMALAVNGRERRFYEWETGVLGRKPLPDVKAPNPPDDTSTIGRTQRGRPDSGSAWDSEPGHDPWGDEGGSTGGGSVWDPPAQVAADPWGETHSAPAPGEGSEAEWEEAQRILAADARRRQEASSAASSETAQDDYADALAALERDEEARIAAAEEARREAELEMKRKEERGGRSSSSASSGGDCAAAMRRAKELEAKAMAVLKKLERSPFNEELREAHEANVREINALLAANPGC